MIVHSNQNYAYSEPKSKNLVEPLAPAINE